MGIVILDVEGPLATNKENYTKCNSSFLKSWDPQATLVYYDNIGFLGVVFEE